MKVIFNTYNEAIKAARNAYKDGYNTIIRKIIPAEGIGEVVFINEYFKKESERFHD